MLLPSSRPCSLPHLGCPWLHAVRLDWAAGGLCSVPTFPSPPATPLSSHGPAQLTAPKAKVLSGGRGLQEHGRSSGLEGSISQLQALWAVAGMNWTQPLKGPTATQMPGSEQVCSPLLGTVTTHVVRRGTLPL